MDVCLVKGCGSPAKGRGLCYLHYQRLRKNGSPLKTRKAQSVGLSPKLRFARYAHRRTDGCWQWTGGTTAKGYGLFRLRGRSMTAAKAAWLLYRGEVPDRHWVCHGCENPLCVNPDHLFIETPENIAADRIRYGHRHRTAVGERPLREHPKLAQLVCCIKGCDRPINARDMCKYHYARFHEKTTPESLEKRLLRHRRRTSVGCWLFVGSRQKFGYGQLRGDNGAPELAHRAAWKVWRGPIPKGKYILHRCHNPACFNPDHLMVGTQQDNMDQMHAAGRQKHAPALGERNGNSKLTAQAVKTIRRSRKTVTELARMFGVSASSISAVRKRKIWTHVK